MDGSARQLDGNPRKPREGKITMELCLHNGRCMHPLPCSVHGTHREPVAVALEGYSWLVGPLATGGRMLTLFRGSEVVETRLLSAAASEEEASVRRAMLSSADLLPHSLSDHVLVGS